MIDVKSCLNEAQEKMDEAVMYLEDALAHIRAGKADVRILDGIRVDSYGSMVPLNNVAALGIMPENNGEIIRLGIPPLTEERRRTLAKQCSKEAETAKVSIRNARRDSIDKLKKAIKDGLSEDVEKDAENDLQKLHDKAIKQIDALLAAKEKEIMTV